MKRSLKTYGLLVGFVFFLVPVLASGSLVYFFVKDEVETRRLVTFMNFEQLTHRFQSSLQGLSAYQQDGDDLRFDRAPTALLDDKLQTKTGLVPDGVELKGLKGVCDMQTIGNDPYILCPLLLPSATVNSTALNSGMYWGIWRLTSDDFAILSKIAPHRAFLVSRRNQVIFQSDNPIPQANLLKKQLVQDFIKSPLSKEATAPYTDAGTQVIGFAMLIPQTNMALFVESPASTVFATLLRPTAISLGILIAGLAFLFFLWKLVMGTFQDQIMQLSQSLLEFSGGFHVPTQHQQKDFLPELSPLVEALNSGTLQVRSRLDEKKSTAEPEASPT